MRSQLVSGGSFSPIQKAKISQASFCIPVVSEPLDSFRTCAETLGQRFRRYILPFHQAFQRTCKAAQKVPAGSTNYHYSNAVGRENSIQIRVNSPLSCIFIPPLFCILSPPSTAVDFERKTITIKHTVNEVTLNGKQTVIEKDRTKTKSSYRSLPLIEPFEELLHKFKAVQEQNRKVCGRAYSKDYLEYIYVDELGERIKPGYITQNFEITLKNHGMRKIRFHDSRHSCASLLYAHGVSLKEIQEWLGHSDISTTSNIYTHLDFKSKIASANAIIGVYSG